LHPPKEGIVVSKAANTMKLLRARAKHEASIPTLSTLDFVGRDLADAKAHIDEALELVACRVPGHITDKLHTVSFFLERESRGYVS